MHSGTRTHLLQHGADVATGLNYASAKSKDDWVKFLLNSPSEVDVKNLTNETLAKILEGDSVTNREKIIDYMHLTNSERKQDD